MESPRRALARLSFTTFLSMLAIAFAVMLGSQSANAWLGDGAGGSDFANNLFGGDLGAVPGGDTDTTVIGLGSGTDFGGGLGGISSGSDLVSLGGSGGDLGNTTPGPLSPAPSAPAEPPVAPTPEPAPTTPWTDPNATITPTGDTLPPIPLPTTDTPPTPIDAPPPAPPAPVEPPAPAPNVPSTPEVDEELERLRPPPPRDLIIPAPVPTPPPDRAIMATGGHQIIQISSVPLPFRIDSTYSPMYQVAAEAPRARRPTARDLAEGGPIVAQQPSFAPAASPAPSPSPRQMGPSVPSPFTLNRGEVITNNEGTIEFRSMSAEWQANPLRLTIEAGGSFTGAGVNPIFNANAAVTLRVVSPVGGANVVFGSTVSGGGSCQIPLQCKPTGTVWPFIGFERNNTSFRAGPVFDLITGGVGGRAEVRVNADPLPRWRDWNKELLISPELLDPKRFNSTPSHTSGNPASPISWQAGITEGSSNPVDSGDALVKPPPGTVRINLSRPPVDWIDNPSTRREDADTSQPSVGAQTGSPVSSRIASDHTLAGFHGPGPDSTALGNHPESIIVGRNEADTTLISAGEDSPTSLVDESGSSMWANSDATYTLRPDLTLPAIPFNSDQPDALSLSDYPQGIPFDSINWGDPVPAANGPSVTSPTPASGAGVPSITFVASPFSGVDLAAPVERPLINTVDVNLNEPEVSRNLRYHSADTPASSATASRAAASGQLRASGPAAPSTTDSVTVSGLRGVEQLTQPPTFAPERWESWDTATLPGVRGVSDLMRPVPMRPNEWSSWFNGTARPAVVPQSDNQAPLIVPWWLRDPNTVQEQRLDRAMRMFENTNKPPLSAFEQLTQASLSQPLNPVEPFRLGDYLQRPLSLTEAGQKLFNLELGSLDPRTLGFTLTGQGASGIINWIAFEGKLVPVVMQVPGSLTRDLMMQSAYNRGQLSTDWRVDTGIRLFVSEATVIGTDFLLARGIDRIRQPLAGGEPPVNTFAMRPGFLPVVVFQAIPLQVTLNAFRDQVAGPNGWVTLPRADGSFATEQDFDEYLSFEMAKDCLPASTLNQAKPGLGLPACALGSLQTAVGVLSSTDPPGGRLSAGWRLLQSGCGDPNRPFSYVLAVVFCTKPFTPPTHPNSPPKPPRGPLAGPPAAPVAAATPGSPVRTPRPTPNLVPPMTPVRALLPPANLAPLRSPGQYRVPTATAPRNAVVPPRRSPAPTPQWTMPAPNPSPGPARPNNPNTSAGWALPTVDPGAMATGFLGLIGTAAYKILEGFSNGLRGTQ